MEQNWHTGTNKPSLLAIIAGRKKHPQCRYQYLIVLYENTQGGARIAKKVMAEDDLIDCIRTGRLVLQNATVKDRKLVGTTGSLERLDPENCLGGISRVILKVIKTNGKNGNKQIVGYYIASSNGKVANVKLSDVIRYCEKASQDGNVAFQNAMYVSATRESRAHLRAYPGGEFPVEEITINYVKPTTTKVNYQENKKNLDNTGKRRLEDIFNQDQIKVIKDGIKKGLNVKLYANPKLSASQMDSLEYALEVGVNPHSYAHPSFSTKQMDWLTTRLKRKARIAEITNPKFNVAQMAQLSYAMDMGLDIQELLNPEIPAREMEEMITRMEKATFYSIDLDESFKKINFWN